MYNELLAYMSGIQSELCVEHNFTVTGKASQYTVYSELHVYTCIYTHAVCIHLASQWRRDNFKA